MSITKKLLAFITPCLLLLASCGATTIELSKFKGCSDMSNANKQVKVEGYFSLQLDGHLVLCTSDKSPKECIVSIALQPDGGSPLGVSLKVGNSPNRLKDDPAGDLQNRDPENRRRLSASLKFLTADGQLIGTSDRVRVTGKYIAAACYVDVENIEKL